MKVVWVLLNRHSECPSPTADMILRVTQNVEKNIIANVTCVTYTPCTSLELRCIPHLDEGTRCLQHVQLSRITIESRTEI